MSQRSTSPRRPNISGGILLFRRIGNALEVLLAHPGGPFWKDRDTGAWSIPKGLVGEGEDLLAAARREFAEETGLTLGGSFIPLGTVRQKAGKLIHAWAHEGNADPAMLKSNVMRTHWPPRSGRWITIPEVDRCEWFDLATARDKLNLAQADFIDRLEQAVNKSTGQSVESGEPGN